ncbi:MAG: hypothetical protein AMS27_15980 [Bacteroides sp. SM23_62_1]|nr:MAG: hypothetical protein AMS27_15980 [Bacteroides sp. SM23_62_1]
MFSFAKIPVRLIAKKKIEIITFFMAFVFLNFEAKLCTTFLQVKNNIPDENVGILNGNFGGIVNW